MRRKEIAVAAALLAGAAALRAAAAAAAFDPDVVFDKFPLLARRIIADGWLAREPFAYSPAYTYFLAVLTRLGATPAWMCGVQAALGVATCGLVGAIGRRLFDPVAGAIATAGAAVFGPFLLYAIELESDGLGVFLDCAAALALLLALDRPSGRRFAIAGLILGLRAAQRPDALLLLALVVIFLVASARGAAGRREALRRSSLYVVAALLPILPIAAQNARASGEIIPVTSSGGWVLYTSHNWAARGLSYFPPPLAKLLMEAPAPQKSAALEPAGAAAAEDEAVLDRLDDRVSRRIASLVADRELSAGEASRFWRREALRSIERRGFRRQAALQARRLFYMLHAYEAQDSLPLLLKEERLGWLAAFDMGLVAALGLLGIVLVFRRGAGAEAGLASRPSRSHLPMLAFLVAPVLSMSLFYVGARFRLELGAMLLPLAGLAVVRLVSDYLARRWRSLLAFGSAVVVLTALLHSPDREIARQQRMRVVQLHTFLAQRAGDQKEAFEEFRLATSAAAYPAEAEAAWRGLARIQRERGDERAAERALRTASGLLEGRTYARLASKLNDPDAQWAVGVHHIQRGEMARAAVVLGEAARLAPDDPDILLARTFAASESGALSPDQAAALVEEALDVGLRFSPNAPTAYRLAARCYRRLGERDKAEEAAEAARRYQAFLDDRAPAGSP